jgi:hypothetical protein
MQTMPDKFWYGFYFWWLPTNPCSLLIATVDSCLGLGGAASLCSCHHPCRPPPPQLLSLLLSPTVANIAHHCSQPCNPPALLPHPCPLLIAWLIVAWCTCLGGQFDGEVLTMGHCLCACNPYHNYIWFTRRTHSMHWSGSWHTRKFHSSACWYVVNRWNPSTPDPTYDILSRQPKSSFS